MGYTSGALPTPMDAATNAWVAAALINGGRPTNARIITVDALIIALKATGVWAKLDRLWLFAASDQPSALTDLVNTSLATAINSPTFTTDRGIAGNGSTSYIDTGYNPATNAVNFSLNSVSLHFWVATGHAAADGQQDGGVATNTFSSELTGRSNTTSGLYAFQLNDASPAQVTNSGNTTGFFGGVRSSSTARNIYQNGVDTLGANSQVSVSVPSANIYVGARDQAGAGAGNFANQQTAAYAIGGALTAAQALSFYTRMRLYMTAVGVP